MRRSESIAALAGALSKARADFKAVIKAAENPYFKSNYADLSTLIDATKDGLSKNGLCLIQSPGKITETNRVSITSLLIHSSGEWLEDDLEMPVTKADAQGLGSAITYGRRYAYQSILNIAGEDDDDGNAAVGRTQKDRKGSSTDMSTTDGENINPTQARAFWAATKQGNKSKADVQKWFGEELGIEHTDEMLKKDFNKAMKWAVKPSEDLTGIAKESVEKVKETQYTPF